MSDAGATKLATMLAAANRGAAQEIVMQSDQVPFVVANGSQSALGAATSNGELFDMLSEVLSDEQQIELAVGNLVEFTLTVGGVGWHLVTEPGVEGVSVRGRVSGGMSSENKPGRSVQLPAVGAGPEYRKRSSTDLPTALDDELDIELSDAPPPAADPFAGDPFDDVPFDEEPGGNDPFAEAPPAPAASSSGVDFAMPDSPPPPSDQADPDPGGYDPFANPGVQDQDPLGGLDAPYAGTRQDMPAQASAAGQGAAPDDLPPVLDDDEDDDGFTADFAFVDGGVSSSAPSPSGPARNREVDDAVRHLPSTRETERVGDAGSRRDPDEESTLDEVDDAPRARKHNSSGATVQISAAEAANEMARQLARQGGTREHQRRSGTGTTFRAVVPDRASWEVVSGADELDKLTRFIGEGSLVHVLGNGGLEIAGDEPSMCFLDGDQPQQNLDATEGHEPGTWVILSLDDPSPWLGWILRRLEEGHRVLVESRARTAEGAWRVLLGVDGGRRAESWVAHHAHLGIVTEEGRYKLLRRRT